MAPSHSSLKRPAAALPGTPRKSKDAKAAERTPVKAEPKSPAAPKASTAPKDLPRIPQSEAKKMHQKLKTLKQKGDSSLADKYDKCASQAEKRNFYYNVYMLDPSVSAKAVLKKDIDMQGTVTTEQEGWWTQDQICGHKGVLPHNPAYKELAVAAVAGLEERPHEDPELAKLGLKQYKFCVVEHKAKSKKMQGLELKESVAEVDTDDFHAMRLAVSGGTKQVMIGTKKDKEALKDREKDKDAESEQGEEEPLADQYKTAYKKAKAALNSLSSELSGLEVVEGKLAEVEGHDKMKVAYKEQLEASMELLQDAKQDALKRFKAFPGKADSEDGAKTEKDLEKVKELTEKCVAELKKVKKATSAIKKWVENA